MSEIKVLTVDDNNIQAEGLKKLFEACPKIKYRGNVNTPERCLDRIANDRMIDIILMDIKFPKSEINGIQLAKKIREKHPFSINGNGKPTTPRIIFFSVYDQAIVKPEEGIHGIIPKNEDFDTIVNLIEMVHKHGITIPPAHSNGHSENEENQVETLFWEKLTKSEKKVFSHVMKGLTSNEIASKMHNSPDTIKVHRKKILRKLKSHGYPNITKIDDPKIIIINEKHQLCKD